MAIDVSTLTDYAWSDIAKAAKTAMITAALGGGQLTINGRSIGRISIKDAQALYELAQAQVEAAAAGESVGGGGNVLVKFEEES